MKNIFSFIISLIIAALLLYMSGTSGLYTSKPIHDFLFGSKRLDMSMSDMTKSSKAKNINTPLPAQQKEAAKKSESRLIVIDPGHGGIDDGTCSEELLEKDVCLDIAIKLEKRLTEKNIPVYMTRTDDSFSGPIERIDAANKRTAALFVSIHNNWFKDPALGGITTLYHPQEDLGAARLKKKAFAEIIHNELIEALPMVDRGIAERPNLAVLRHAQMPSVLIELGFMSNKEDAELLKSEDFCQKAADALSKGIVKALEKEVRLLPNQE